MRVPAPSFAHLEGMSTADGLFEHAEFAMPRTEHGFCVDDVARGLVVTAREPSPTDMVRRLSATYLAFTVDAIAPDGSAHNRRQDRGDWTDAPGTGDHWGRALWGLGTAAASSVDEDMRERALAGARRMLQARSTHPRAMAHASVGAREVLRAAPGDSRALALLRDARTVIGRPAMDPRWPWPQPRLGYANALLPEAMMVIGEGLDDERAFADGIALLAWLVEQETRGTHLSVTPTGGRGPGDVVPGYDQQPIEVSSLAEASARALAHTGDARWAYVLDRCSAWFLGWNDVGLALYDPATGGGHDGLLRDAVNLNQGAESTLSAIATFQLARAALLVPVS
ncbi:MAG: glycosyltransferase [Actinomycetota bacterium]|nr:glycosyltransferase [Actinomycetota bacterium]